MKNYIIKPLISEPGIQRDGTIFASKSYIDGQWCRFYMGRPRKIGGYKLIDVGNSEIIRDLFGVSLPSAINVYLGRASSVKYINFDFNGNGGLEIDRTPTDGTFVANSSNSWTFDLFTNTSDVDVSSSYIVAHVALNGTDNSNVVNGNIYYGDSTTSSPLDILSDESGNPIQVSGGIVFTSPILVAYGNDGIIRWCTEGVLTDWPDANTLVVTNTKIIKAYRARGSTSPQLLVWTLTSLLNLTYTVIDTISTFSVATVQDDITVMSPGSIVQYNQQFFWIGIDQFYYYNGIVNQLENTMSSDWFFQNVNLTYRARIFGVVIPRYKEIWWFYPKGSATECTDVIIYNTELNKWYDSVLGRSAALSSSIFPFPMMSDTVTTKTTTTSGFINTYGLWMHEYGLDKEYGTNTVSIDSYFETSIQTLFSEDPTNNRLMRTRRIEPDFLQIGTMTVTVNNRMFPSGSTVNGGLIKSGPYTFTPDTLKVDDVNSQGRLVSFVFDSNVAGGYYQAGNTLFDYEIGDIQP